MVTTPAATSEAFTYADLEALPDDGKRHELSYGALVVTPAPDTRHQALLTSVAALLHGQRRPSEQVLVEADLFVQADLVKRPDVQVVDKDLVGGQSVTGTPLLVVEVHSPSTKVLDLTEKRHVYAEAGIPAYWLVDPEQATLTILELADDTYVERAVLRGDDELELTRPFPMTVRGSDVFA